jgi:drug/metabolite transporter (DMT)-like permease
MRNPVVVTALGAMCIASSGILVRLADTGPVTVAFFRCLYALPVLGVIALIENRRFGPLPSKALRLSWIAGVFFATDLIFWHQAIDAVGAGLATVLGNLQVLIVGFAAWALLKERPHGALLAAIPIVLVGVVLISGLLGDPYGKDPTLGVVFGVATSIAYAGFILVLRQGAGNLERVAGPLFHATLSSTIVALAYGMVTASIEWNPGWPSHGWLITLALSAQVVGWLLISHSLPRLPAAITSVLLLLQPVGSMVLARLVLDERPSIEQLVGAALILAGVVVATARHRNAVPAEPEGALV